MTLNGHTGFRAGSVSEADRQRGDTALVWAIVALIILGTVRVAVTSDVPLSEMPDEVSSMMGLTYAP